MARALILTASALSVSVAASATPVYYTFSGTVYASDVDSLPVGSPVTYTFLIDQARTAYVELFGVRTDFTDNNVYDWFYSEYVGGSAVPRPPATSPHTLAQHASQSFFQGDNTYMIASVTAVYWNEVFVFGSGLISTWTEGKVMDFAHDRFEDPFGGGTTANVYSDLTLTSIDPNPLPEPGTILLLGSALLGTAFRLRRATHPMPKP